MKKTDNIFLAVAGLLAVALLSGCAEVRPWERNILARPEMQLTPDKLSSYVDDHIYFSKEAATGGKAVGGGGCGCN
ncbi:MAG TPA: DUF4266 domain-containing protein [Gammaproteobacteria bacterium]